METASKRSKWGIAILLGVWLSAGVAACGDDGSPDTGGKTDAGDGTDVTGGTTGATETTGATGSDTNLDTSAAETDDTGDPVETDDTGGLTDPGLPPRDIAPQARLTVSGTRTVLLWPREDREGPGTIRDDADDTAWVPPPGAPATLCLDWQPWVGRPVWVKQLELEGDGVTAAPVTVTALTACGGPPLAEPVSVVAAPIVPLELAAGALEIAFAPAKNLRVSTVRVLSTDALPTAAPRIAAPAPPPASFRAGSGVVEGFYGVPWSWDERARIVALLGQTGGGSYFYAPKLDPLHRDEWRTPYPGAFVDRFVALATAGASQNVTVRFGVSPFIGFDETADYATLLAKFRVFADRGVRGFVLLADDIEGAITAPVDAVLGATHARIVKRLADDLAEYDGLSLWFVPTVYSDERLDGFADGAGYLRAVGAIDPSVAILWTGVGTFAATMTPADMTRVTGLLGRPPLIWDNYWANDAGDGFSGRMLLGAFAGRPGALVDAVDGIVHNPLIQGAASRLALGTFIGWANDPARTPDELRALAAELETAQALRADPGLVPLLVALQTTFDGAANGNPVNAAFVEACAGLTAQPAVTARDAPALGAALAVFGRMATLASRAYHSGAEPGLVDDLLAPLEKVVATGEAALYELLVLRERRAGRGATGFQAQADAAADAASRNRFVADTGALVDLEKAVRSVATANAPDSPGAWNVPSPPACEDGAIAWSLGPGDWSVSGLDGAVLTAGTLTWIAPHRGRYRVAVTAARSTPDFSWTAWVGDIDCF
jgi:hyaluronoglucosaminidase